MPELTPDEDQHNTSRLTTFDHRDPRQRLVPSFPETTAPLLTLKHSQEKGGFGVYASRQIQPNTVLLDTNNNEAGAGNGPAMYVIYRTFRKEVCAWCFRYEQGRNWKVRLLVEAESGGGGGGRSTARWGGSRVNTGRPGAGPGVVFCREECRDAWRDQYGDVGTEALTALESFVQKQARCRGWSAEISDEDGDDERVPSEDEIEQAWQTAEEQASHVRSLRLNPQSPHTKTQKQALAQVTALPILNTDMLFFLFSGALCASSSQRSSSDIWKTLLTLNPSLHLNIGTLRQLTSTFLHLTAILPPSLLPYVIRESLEAVLSRDTGNSFGIWSTRNESGSDRKSIDTSDRQEIQQEEGAEMLGYGTWPIASFFNHSCIPNVARRRIGRHWVFSAAREVSEDEELCISYIRGGENTLSLGDRRKRLQDAWGFTCQCAKCVREEESQTI